MAAQVKLVRRGDFSSDISSLSLFNYEDGFSLARNGWTQMVAHDDDASVSEVLTLHIESTDHDDLASKIDALDDKIREVAWYRDSSERYGIWLRTQMPDETEARQALILNARGSNTASLYAPPVSPGNFMREGYELALERMPWWEATSSHAYTTSSLSCLGGMESYGIVYGNKPSRIARTNFVGSAAGAGGGEDPLYEFWMGFRTDRFGDRTNFVPVWDIGQSNDSTPSNDTSSVSDTTAEGGYKWRCSFGADLDPAMLKRVSTAVMSHTSNYADQRGEYVVLVRMKVGSGTTCHIRLEDGFTYTSALRAQPRVKVDSTSWYLYPLGTVNIPPSRGIVEADFLRQYGFDIYAERTAGSSYLDMDCLILIPYNEGFIHVSGGGVKYILGDTRPITVKVHPNEDMDGWWYTLNMPYASVAVESEGYALPVGAGSLVLAGQRETAHDLDDRVIVRLYTYRRYRTLRGAG